MHYRQMFNNRAQAGNFLILVYAVIALVVVSLVVLTGLDIANEFGNDLNETAFEDAINETVTPYHCNNAGILGCNTNPIVVPIAAGVSVALGLVIGGISRYIGAKTDREPSNVCDSDADAITVIQHKYVNGEIQTEEQLERELEWYIYPQQNDGDDTE